MATKNTIIQDIDRRFNNYYRIVQAKAKEQNKAFFLDVSEGHDGDKDDLHMEDLSGWLVNVDDAEEFRFFWKHKKSQRDKIPAKFEDCYLFVEWHLDADDKLIIEFKRYE